MIDFDLNKSEHIVIMLFDYVGLYRKYFRRSFPSSRMIVSCGYHARYNLIFEQNKIMFRRYSSVLKEVDLHDADGPTKIRKVIGSALNINDKVNIIKIDPNGEPVDIHAKNFDNGDFVVIEFEK